MRRAAAKSKSMPSPRPQDSTASHALHRFLRSFLPLFSLKPVELSGASRGLSDARDATCCRRFAPPQPVAAAQLVRVPCGGPLLLLPQPLDAGEHEVDLRARREGVNEQLRVERAMRAVRP